MPGAFFDNRRAGVNRATHPPLSGETGFPGSTGSYFADDVQECTTPGLTRSVSTAMQSTAPRSL